MSDMPIDSLVSFGAGVNSTALVILLANEGWRGRIVFSDTGCEWPDTYCYMDAFERDWLQPRGLSITRIGAEWRPPCFRMSLIERCELKGTIPVRYPRWCTSNFKVRPFQKWCKANGIDHEDAMIGIAVDEAHRMPDARRPLVDRSITRSGCIEIIQAAGLDVPRKSGCYLCPFQTDRQWHELWQRYPDLYARVEALEHHDRRNPGKGKRQLIIDPSGATPLEQRRQRYEQQTTMEFLNDGYLLLAKPCLCHV